MMKDIYVCYEWDFPLFLTIQGWREYYSIYITEWDSFYDWWLDMRYRYCLIYPYEKHCEVKNENKNK